METIKVERGEDIVEVIKCKADEILFVRYDPARDPECTSALMKDLLAYCEGLGVPCLGIPKSDEDVYAELEQWDAERLRAFDNKIQEMIRKKSPLIIQ